MRKTTSGQGITVVVYDLTNFLRLQLEQGEWAHERESS